MRKRSMPPSGLLVASVVLMIHTSAASAEEHLLLAQAESTTREADTIVPIESSGQAAQPESQEEVEPYGSWMTARPGIEERIIVIGESESAADFDAADSVAGFDASDIEALGALNVADIARFTPNLQIVTAGSTSPTFFIRGVGLNDFSSNSTGAVALFTDDVQINAPAMQLGTFFDLQGVNVERGPVGTGPYRGATAGAIRAYSAKPSGEYGGYLRSSFGNYGSVDVEGAAEAPIWKDILSVRLSFRFTEREGYAFNRCGNAPAHEDRTVRDGGDPTDPRWSICGDNVLNPNLSGTIDGKSRIPEGLPTWVNDRFNWGARANFLFEPTLDQSWLLNFHGSRRDQMSTLGQAYGTGGIQNYPPYPPAEPGPKIAGLLGGPDGGQYTDLDVANRHIEIKDALLLPMLSFCRPNCTDAEINRVGQEALLTASLILMNELGADLDPNPYAGAYDRVGPTINDTWGGYLKGEIALPGGLELTTITSYDAYDRLIDVDLDYSPNVLFEITTDDTGWQFAQDLRVAGTFFNRFADTEWAAGALYFKERLRVGITNDFGDRSNFGIAERKYQQDIDSIVGWLDLSWDFWNDFTLDGGVRYTWEQKSIDYEIFRVASASEDFQEIDYSAPTGMLRLTYRFRDDTHAFWKYTHGVKGPHYNATADVRPGKGVTFADTEIIDSFEGGIRGSWLDGRLGLNMQLFYYAYENYQLFTVQNATAFPEFVVINASDVEVYGGDLELVGRPWNGFFVQARVGWLESQFLDFVETQIFEVSTGTSVIVIEQKVDHSGNRLLNSPEFEVALTGEQSLPLNRFGEIVLRYDGVWRDDNFYNATEGRGLPNRDGDIFLPPYTLGQKAFWIHNLRATYRTADGVFEVSAWVRNLTDFAYRQYSFDAAAFNETTLHFIGEPRMFGGTISVHF